MLGVRNGEEIDNGDKLFKNYFEFSWVCDFSCVWISFVSIIMWLVFIAFLFSIYFLTPFINCLLNLLWTHSFPHERRNGAEQDAIQPPVSEWIKLIILVTVLIFQRESREKTHTRACTHSHTHTIDAVSRDKYISSTGELVWEHLSSVSLCRPLYFGQGVSFLNSVTTGHHLFVISLATMWRSFLTHSTLYPHSFLLPLPF